MNADHQLGGTGDAEGPAVQRGPLSERRRNPVDYDAELRLHTKVLRWAYGIRRHFQVLDIGCGTGQTTREAARVAITGSAVGVDLSEQMIHRARELAQSEGLRNVTFEHADAQHHPFQSEHFDLVISRFGTMFFDDPVAAFANIGQGVRPGGRLVMMVWQTHAQNEWSVSIQRSLTGAAAAPPAPGATDPFSLGDPATVEGILNAAEFSDVTFTDVREPVYYGRDVVAALDWVRGFTSTSDALKRLDPGSAERALERLRETLSAHSSADGIWFDSRAWIVKARRR